MTIINRTRDGGAQLRCSGEIYVRSKNRINRMMKLDLKRIDNRFN